MLDRVSTATKEMAGAAVLAFRAANRLGNLGPFRRIIGLAVGLEDHTFLRAGIFRVLDILGGIARTGWKLFVGSCFFMTDKTVDLFLRSEVKTIVLPTITGMT